MSHCIDCAVEMHPADAAESLVCWKCISKRKGGAGRIKTISDTGADRKSRHETPVKEYAGCPPELLDALEGDDDPEDRDYRKTGSQYGRCPLCQGAVPIGRRCRRCGE